MKLKKYKLGEILDVKRGASLVGEHFATEGKYVRLTCGNFDYNNNCFKENTSKDNIYYTGAVKQEFIMKEGDIITPLTEQAIGLLGSTATIPESNKYIQSQDVAKIICKEHLLIPQYAYYLISSKHVKKQLSAAAQQTKIRHTSPDKIKDCVVWIPDIDIQKPIGDLLSNIDHKIALNRRINAKLEQIAKRLYDYWFVQFDFPNEEGKPYKSSGGKMVWNEVLKREVPEGWEIVQLKSVIKQISTGLNPRNNFVLGNGDIRYITVKNLTEKGIINFSNCDFIDKKAQELVHNRSQIEKGDILFASICPLGRCYLIQERPTNWDINESVFSIRPNTDKITSEFLYSILRDAYYVKKMTQKATGSVFKGIRINDIEKIEIILPPQDIIKAFNAKTLSIFNYQLSIEKETAQLTALRDKLLPLLMNGQVEVE